MICLITNDKTCNNDQSFRLASSCVIGLFAKNDFLNGLIPLCLLLITLFRYSLASLLIL